MFLDEDQSFSLWGNVESTGYQRIALSGYLVSRRSDGVYVAPLIPSLFYGADGSQLATWRQYIPGTGNQLLLSRSGGKPEVPRSELYWRKVRSAEVERKEEARPVAVPPNWAPALAVAAAVIIGVVAVVSMRD